MNIRAQTTTFLAAALAVNTVFSIGLGMEMSAGPDEVASHACCPVSQSQAPQESEEGGPSCCTFAPALLPGVYGASALQFVRAIIADAPIAVNVALTTTSLKALPPPGYQTHTARSTSSRAPPRA
jgi:hypothetical protein